MCQASRPSRDVLSVSLILCYIIIVDSSFGCHCVGGRRLPVIVGIWPFFQLVLYFYTFNVQENIFVAEMVGNGAIFCT